MLRLICRGLGRFYLLAALLVTVLAAHVIVLASTSLLALWVHLSGPAFGRIVAVTQGLTLLESAVTLWWSWRRLASVRRWMQGRRDEHEKAWLALITLPRTQLRTGQVVATVVTVVPASVYITYEVDGSRLGFLAVLAAAYVVLLYGIVWRILILELTLRPAVELTSAGLTERVAGERGGVPLAFKLFACIPLSNVGTGLAIAGLSSDSKSGLRELGFDVALAVGFAFTASLGLTLLLAGSILGPLRALIRATRRVAENELDDPVPVTSTDETGELTESFNAMVEAVGEREKLREAFGAFVDPNLTERVLREGTNLQGEDVDVSVLFLDVENFTSFAEETEAHEVVRSLNDLFETVVPCVHENGGQIDKFVGDGLVAVFGAPERLDDHAARAVAAARAIVDRVNGDRRGDGDGGLRVGVGVNTGPVIAGTVGGGGRLDFTVIGDTVNTAARVEQLTRRTDSDLLITEATRDALDGDGTGWGELADTRLEGKREPVRVFAPPP